MDRTVVVLTPNEFENRITLKDLSNRSYQHCHNIKNAQIHIRTCLYFMRNAVNDGDIEKFNEWAIKAENSCADIHKQAISSQRFIGEIGTVLDYKLIQEDQMKGRRVELLQLVDFPRTFLKKGEYVTVFPETYDEKTETVEIMEDRYGSKATVHINVLGGAYMEFLRDKIKEEKLEVVYDSDVGHFDGLTRGCKYVVLSETDSQYVVYNDYGSGAKSTISKDKFRIVK